MTQYETLDDPVRYAVVGLGWFAQAAILPAFDNARESSRLAALVSGDGEKLAELGDRYDVPGSHRVGYDDYDELLASGEIDAVYLALPNHLHRDYTVRAAEAGVHVLTEKPMAVTEAECREMIEAAEANDVRLMVAYRLHFEAANLRAVEIVREGTLGDVRAVNAVFANPVGEGDIRLNPIEKGGGTVYDIGIYCINAARYVLRAEPEEVSAFSTSGDDPRFADCDETTVANLRFPGGRLATFVSTFGAADRDGYRVLGTKGDLLVEPGFQFKGTLSLELTVDGETSGEDFEERDQIAPEILHFSHCVRSGENPEPSGLEGLADVRVIEAIYRSAAAGGRPVHLEPLEGLRYPDPSQETYRPAPGKQELVHESGP